MNAHLSKHVVVIGAGVIGLTCALRLKQAGYTISIVARDFPGELSIDYASPWAGAHFRPVPVTDVAGAMERKLSQETYDHFKEVAASHPEAGIRFCDGLEFFDAPSAAYTDLKLEQDFCTWEGFEVLPREALPMGAKWGVKYRAWILNSPVYLEWLREQLGSETRWVRRTISSPDEAISAAVEGLQAHGSEPAICAVINSTGIGLNDPASFISRGQFLHVSSQYHNTISYHHADGSSCVVVPRPCEGGTLIGGSKEPRDYNTEPSNETTRWILEEIARLCPDLLGIPDGNPSGEPTMQVLSVNVGRRPMRSGGMRIEREDLVAAELGSDVTGQVVRKPVLVHCYGAGGSGFKVSWGAARMVVELVER